MIQRTHSIPSLTYTHNHAIKPAHTRTVPVTKQHPHCNNHRTLTSSFRSLEWGRSEASGRGASSVSQLMVLSLCVGINREADHCHLQNPQPQIPFSPPHPPVSVSLKYELESVDVCLCVFLSQFQSPSLSVMFILHSFYAFVYLRVFFFFFLHLTFNVLTLNIFFISS